MDLIDKIKFVKTGLDLLSKVDMNVPENLEMSRAFIGDALELSTSLVGSMEDKMSSFRGDVLDALNSCDSERYVEMLDKLRGILNEYGNPG